MPLITHEELEVYGEISRLAKSVWDESLKVDGLSQDPKMFSIMLFKRLWSNHRGYTLLHNNNFSLESQIILRSGLEAAICIAANYELRDEFVAQMRSDAAFTLQRQIKLYRGANFKDLVRDSEAYLRTLIDSLPEDAKPAKLNMKTLAQLGKVPALYDFYQELSGVSAHVTGMSVLRGTIGADGHYAEEQNELKEIDYSRYLMMMAFATLKGSILHSIMIGKEDYAVAGCNLLDKMNTAQLNSEESN